MRHAATVACRVPPAFGATAGTRKKTERDGTKSTEYLNPCLTVLDTNGLDPFGVERLLQLYVITGGHSIKDQVLLVKIAKQVLVWTVDPI